MRLELELVPLNVTENLAAVPFASWLALPEIESAALT
jgi:hypothetical protein